jgi:rubrerythrin
MTDELELCAICGVLSADLNDEGECPGCEDEELDEEESDA